MSNLTAVKQDAVEQEPAFFSQLKNIKAEVDGKPVAKVIADVRQLVRDIDTSNVELAGNLSRVKEVEPWLEGINFAKWLESENIGQTRGYELAKTFDALVECDLPIDIMDSVGWSKLCIVATSLQPGGSKKAYNFNAKWIEKAKTASQAELKEWVKMEKPGADKVETFQHVLKLPAANEETFNAAIEFAKEEVKAETEVEAVDVIMAGYLVGKSKAVTLKDLMIESQPEDVLELFAEIWPDIQVTVKL